MKFSSTGTQRERTPRSLWFDPRFAIGIGLVVVSVLGVLAIVSTTDRSVQVYTARTTLTPGETVTAADLVATRVGIGDLDDKYLRADDVMADGFVVNHTVGRGELVPTSAVSARSSGLTASVVLTIHGALPSMVKAGSRVDVWSSAQDDDRTFAAPTVLAPSAIVARVTTSDSVMAGQNAGSVEVLVPRARLAAVLEAIANENAISLVPTGSPLERRE